MAVDATRGHQAHDVYRFACLHGLVDGAGQRCVGEEVTVFDLFIQTGQVLIHDAAGAEVHVTDFRVTHLAIRQADIQTGSGNQGMGLLLPQTVHDRRFGVQDRVVLLLFPVAVTVQDHQYHGLFLARHCSNLFMIVLSCE
ncbi:hypothetical protein D3C75_961740 [compost metagenome]